MKKLMVSILCAIFTFGTTALTAPYGHSSDNIGDVLAELETYINLGEIQPGHGVFEHRQGYHIERRQVYWVDVDDPNLTLDWCEYRGRTWGNGINYVLTQFAPHLTSTTTMAITVYYDYEDPNKAYKNHYKSDFIVSMTVEDGVYNGMPYSAATMVNQNGVEFSTVNLVLGELLVEVFEIVPFNVKRLDDLRFVETDLVLPLYVETTTCPLCTSPNPPTSGNIRGSDTPTIFDALEILKHIVGMDSEIAKCGNAREAALITEESKATGEPTIFDVLEILKYLVGMPSEVG